ncbi:alpha/beta hydrolase [Roseibium alexandrii]
MLSISVPSPARLAVSALLIALLLSACGSRPTTGALAINTEPAAGAQDHDVLIVTTRERDPTPNTYFNGERSETINYAEATISVPPAHKAGAIEWPREVPGDPKTDFVARSAGYIENEQVLLKQLNQRLSQFPKGERDVFLFIHGYNTLFVEGLYRMTQFVHDAKAPVVPVLFTWASRGQLQGYVYDLNSVAIARDSLEQTLRLLARSNADSISILAHSMGNYLLLETVRQLPAEDRRRFTNRVGAVVLAAPDIDIDLFKNSLRKIGRPEKPFVIVVSRDDGALRVSRALAGGVERVGAYSDDEELAELGAIVIDVTDLDPAETSSHGKFAALAEYSPGLRRALLQSGLTDVSSVSGSKTLGDDLGSFVGNTTQAAVTLPIKIIAAPFSLAGGGS